MAGRCWIPAMVKEHWDFVRSSELWSWAEVHSKRNGLKLLLSLEDIECDTLLAMTQVGKSVNISVADSCRHWTWHCLADISNCYWSNNWEMKWRLPLTVKLIQNTAESLCKHHCPVGHRVTNVKCNAAASIVFSVVIFSERDFQRCPQTF